MPVELIVDTKSFNSAIIKLKDVPKQIPKATAQALNRTVDFTFTQTSREVRKEYAVKDRDVKSTLKKNKATPSNLNAYVSSTGRTLTLYNHFNVSPKTPKTKRKYKVKVQIKKGSKVAINSTPKPFIASAKNSTQVFRRVGSARTPVVVLRSLSVPQMVSNKETFNRIQTKASEMLEKRIEHEINRRLEKLGGKS
jgi:hypothetical protein